MSVKLLAEYHLEFLNLSVGYRGSSESTLVKMPHCWKSHIAINNFVVYTLLFSINPHGIVFLVARLCSNVFNYM